MKSKPLMFRSLAILLTPFALASISFAQVFPDGRIDYGRDELDIPPAIRQNFTSPRTVQLLSEAMRDAAPWKRVQLVSEIARCELPEGLEPIRRALSDEDPSVRAEAARAAAAFGDPALLPEVEKLLADEQLAVRRAAINAHARLRQDQAQPSPAVRAALQDQDYHVKLAGLRAAAPADAPLIVQHLNNLDPALQVEAVRALGRIQASDAADRLPPFANRDVPMRAAVVEALGHMQARQHQNIVVNALQDPHPTVRRAAVTALQGAAPEEDRHQHAIAMLQDPDPTVRTAAAELLAINPTPAAVDPLVEQLAYGYRPLHHAAREALIAEGPDVYVQTTIDAGAKLLDHADARRREDGSYILGNRRSDAALDRHIALLDVSNAELLDFDWAVLRQASESLGLIGATVAKEELLTVARMGRNYNRYSAPDDPDMGNPIRAFAAAIIASGRLDFRELFSDLPPMLQISPEVHPPDLRAAVVWAMGMLGEPQQISAGQMFGIYGHIFEADHTKFEALKALGNVRHPQAVSRLRSIAEEDMSPTHKWIAHWAADRITGEQTPYTAPEMRFTAETSIMDLSGR